MLTGHQRFSCFVTRWTESSQRHIRLETGRCTKEPPTNSCWGKCISFQSRFLRLTVRVVCQKLESRRSSGGQISSCPTADWWLPAPQLPLQSEMHPIPLVYMQQRNWNVWSLPLPVHPIWYDPSTIFKSHFKKRPLCVFVRCGPLLYPISILILYVLY